MIRELFKESFSTPARKLYWVIGIVFFVIMTVTSNVKRNAFQSRQNHSAQMSPTWPDAPCEKISPDIPAIDGDSDYISSKRALCFAKRAVDKNQKEDCKEAGAQAPRCYSYFAIQAKDATVCNVFGKVQKDMTFEEQTKRRSCVELYLSATGDQAAGR